MDRTLKMTIAYDGAGFHGWQRQADVRTVQEDLEETAKRIIRHPLNIVGASRTDAGVHARGQVAHLRTSTPIPAGNIRRAIGSRLPKDISVVRVEDVPMAFHATRDPLSKLYRYRIACDERRPVQWQAARHSWHVWWPLDVARMQAAADFLVGVHDFAGFASAGSPRGSTVRSVLRVQVQTSFNEIIIDVEGVGFLYNQVRNMVGTLVEIGRGHWPPERVDEILASRDRSLAGPTAPPQGLCLQWIKYPPYRSPTDES